MRERSRVVMGVLFGPNGVGLDELGLFGALGLIAAGLWRVWSPGAFLAPGLVLLWIWLPSRRPFVLRPPVDAARKDV